MRDEQYLKQFYTLIEKERQRNDLICFTDGSNPDNTKSDTEIQYGFIIYDGNTKMYEYYEKCNDGHTSNIKSEILACVKLLEYLILEECVDEKITVFSDCRFIRDYVFDTSWYSKSTDKPYYTAFVRFRELIKEFSHIKAVWIPRECNQEADDISKI